MGNARPFGARLQFVRCRRAHGPLPAHAAGDPSAEQVRSLAGPFEL
jgi:hypothetical protein